MPAGTRVSHVYIQTDGNDLQLPFGTDFEVYLGPAAGTGTTRCTSPTIQAPTPIGRYPVTASCDCSQPATSAHDWVSVIRATVNYALILSEVQVCQTPAMARLVRCVRRESRRLAFGHYLVQRRAAYGRPTEPLF